MDIFAGIVDKHLPWL